MADLEVDIVKQYPDFSLQVSFGADQETLGIMGASGCGKSQTLRAIAGIVTPDEGLIRFKGHTFFDKKAGSSARVNIKPQRRNVAYLFQNYQLFPSMSVRQNICAGMDARLSRVQKEELLEEQLAFFQLEQLVDKLPRQLSGGQQQRVALARMLASKPDIMMLDEPFSALDVNLKGSLYSELIETLNNFGGPRLYVSHDIDEAFMFCERMIVLDRGKISDQGSTQRVVSNPASLASMKLAGIANISRAKKIGSYRIFAMDWGLELECATDPADDVAYVGIRDNDLEISPADKPFALGSKHWQGLDSSHQPTVNLAQGKVLFHNSGVYRRQTTLVLENALVQDELLDTEVGLQNKRQVQLIHSRSLRSGEQALERLANVKIYFAPNRLRLTSL